MEYKTTLNLPKTNFPMKASLSQNEPKLLELWQKQGLYLEIRKQSKGRPKYVLHDGPPYANGNIHIGHALNKILKDIIIRYKTMRGFDSPYVPGWDCHGLPVEHQLFKELGITKEQIPQVEFRKKAYSYALKFVEVQKEDFIRLGVLGAWDKPYLTLDKKYEHAIVEALGELVKKGFVYRGLKPVNWCATCETALAEAEVEYENKSSPSIYVRFKVANSSLRGAVVDMKRRSNPVLKNEIASSQTCQTRVPRNDVYDDAYLVIWTTTPWTLYGNAAVAVHPNAQYAVVKTPKGALIIAERLLESAFKDIGIDSASAQNLKVVSGKELEGLEYEHPFLKDGIARKVVLADYVSQEEGTGLVHIAPGHGMEDYHVGLKYKLPILMPVDKQGRFDAAVKDFAGQKVFEANKEIIKKLESLNCLLFFAHKLHSYPHCWRCKEPVIFRATKQWFMDIGRNHLRESLISAIEKNIKWVPYSGRERIKTMVELRPDWCLSRQRYWGVPIPAARCLSCNEEFLLPEVIDNFSAKVSSEGTDAWFKENIETFLPKGFVCPSCKSDKFAKGEDILDVWFDSGVSHRAVLMADKEMEFPASLYLEGSDQHRGWFQASLIPSMAIEEMPPFRCVLTHGFVVDGEGKKMSKSLGNVIAPQDIINQYGADILRLWCASSNYSEDVRISTDILLRLTDAYRKIRNTIRFLLANLYDFSPSDAVSYDKMLEIDRYSLSSAYRLLEKVTGYYEGFEFYKIYQELYQFCILQMSNFYLDILKDRLYTFKNDGTARRSAQTVMYEVLLILSKTIAPILPFTAEEIWQHLHSRETGEAKLQPPDSIHLSLWPEMKNKYIDDGLENKWYNLIQFRLMVLKALEEKRASGEIGSSLEARVVIILNKDNEFLKDFQPLLPEIFIVSEVNLREASTVGTAQCAVPTILVSKAKGQKCPRCWNYSEKIGEDKQYLELCPKCVLAL